AEPGCSNAGKITALVFEFLIGAYSARAVSTCDLVRQVGPSGPAHSSAFGSNRQRIGSSSTPSLMPSIASQACRTALWIIGYFSEGMNDSGVSWTLRFTAIRTP